MSFREKSAWVMAVVMTFAGLRYLLTALAAAKAADWRPPPIDDFVPYAMLVVVMSILAQIVMSAWWPKEADAPADERERPLLDRAGNWSGVLLSVGAIASLWVYVRHQDPNLMFHMIVGSLILQQVSEFILQIVLFRRSA